jgi:hypothetical protein
VAGADRKDLVERFQQGGAAKFIQRADFDQAFQRALAHRAQVTRRMKSFRLLNGPSRRAFQDQFNRALAHVLDRAQPKADGGRLIRAVFNGEIPPLVC